MFGKISISLLLAMVFQLSAGAMTTVQFEQYSDLKNAEYSEAIEWTLNEGITQGFTNTEWKPEECITRAQLLKMMIEYRYDGNVADISTTYISPFSDVNQDDWFYDYVSNGYIRGIVEGYSDGTFRPNQCVNRVEAMKVAVETLIYDDLIDNQSAPLYFDDKIIADMQGAVWYSDYANTMFQLRLVGTNHTRSLDDKPSVVKQIKFFPADSMTRKEVAKMMFEIDKLIALQMRNGETYTNGDYGFDITFPSTWGDISVENQVTFEDAALVDEFFITSEDRDNKSLTVYIVDPAYMGNSIITDLPANYFASNGEYDIYLEWEVFAGRDQANEDLRKRQNSDIFKIESGIELFEVL